jgi:glyoxylase-like metal-dependent hydrolase (beta-lactamase superfamily II)
VLTQVADGVHVHRSELLRNNTVVVQGPTGALVVDAGITDAEMSCLAADLRRLGAPAVVGFATHPDWDHALWHRELGDAPRYGTSACAAFLRELRSDPGWRDRFVQALPPEVVGEVTVEPFGLVDALPHGAAHVPWDGPAVRVVEHPAHAVGHAALVVEGARVLVAGDMLSDVFVPMLDDGPDALEHHLAGLEVLAGLVEDVDVVVPGHGSVGRGAQVRERVELDTAYLHALRDGRTPDDPRISSPEPGWEWTTGIHEGQAQRFGRRAEDSPGVAGPH